jgi:hypothetical protein
MNANAVPGPGITIVTPSPWTGSGSMMRVLCLLLLLGLVTAEWYLLSPCKVVMHNHGHDDLLFAILANHMYHGSWLGPFNSLTLAKVPGYPLWLAMEHRLGLPPMSAEYLVYFTAVLVFYGALLNAGMPPLVTTIALCVFLVSPEFYYIESMRLTRNLLYDSLTLLLISVSIAIIQIRSIKLLLPVTLFYSLVLGFYSIVREEFVWILPVHGVYVLCFLYLWRRRGQPRPLLCTALVAFLPMVSVFAVDASIKTINHKYYNVSLLTTQRDGNFPKAMGALQRIRTNSFQQYVPVSQEMRLQAYAVSPSFARLGLQLEGEYNPKLSTRNSCSEAHVCNDYAAQRIYWDIMYAANNLHIYDTANKAENFYGSMATEINNACESGRIACGPPHTSLYPVFRSAMIPDFRDAAHSVLAVFFYPDFRRDLNGQWWKSNDLKVLDTYQELFPKENIYTDKEFAPLENPRKTMGKSAATLWPFIAFIAVFGSLFLVGRCIHDAKKHGPLVSRQAPIMACAIIILTVAILCRLVLLITITATSFRALEGYMAPAYGLTAFLFVIPFVYFVSAVFGAMCAYHRKNSNR